MSSNTDLTDEEVSQISTMLKTNEAQVLDMIQDHFVRTHPMAKNAINVWFQKLSLLMFIICTAENIEGDIEDAVVERKDEQATGQA